MDNWEGIHLMAHQGDLPEVKRLLREDPDLLTCVDPEGWSPLMTASREGHVDVVRYLIEQGAKLDHCDIHGLTALFRAAWNGRTEIVKALLHAGAQPTRRPGDLSTILHAAAINNQVELLTFLLEWLMIETVVSSASVLNIDVKDSHGRTALYQAALKGHTEIIQLLLLAGADPSIKCKLGLHAADAVEKVYKNKQQQANVREACMHLFEEWERSYLLSKLRDCDDTNMCLDISNSNSTSIAEDDKERALTIIPSWAKHRRRCSSSITDDDQDLEKKFIQMEVNPDKCEEKDDDAEAQLSSSVTASACFSAVLNLGDDVFNELMAYMGKTSAILLEM